MDRVISRRAHAPPGQEAEHGQVRGQHEENEQQGVEIEMDAERNRGSEDRGAFQSQQDRGQSGEHQDFSYRSIWAQSPERVSPGAPCGSWLRLPRRVPIVAAAMIPISTNAAAPRNPSWNPRVSDWPKAWWLAMRWLVRLVAMVVRTASPSAPPTCWDVLSRPEARPYSRSWTPVSARIVIGTNAKPRPSAISNDGPSRSAR